MVRVINGIEFVEKNYAMDRRTDRRISSGLQLRDGMTVLIDSSWHRADLDIILIDSTEYHVALSNNRWASISRVYFDKKYVCFTAEYSDGYVTRKQIRADIPWLVKKGDTMGDYTLNILPHHEIIKNWYEIAQRALSDEFADFVAVDVNDGAKTINSKRIAQIASKIAIDAVLPYITNHYVSIATPSHKPVSYGEFMPKYYEMDPETEDVIPTAQDLKVGMCVLLENCMKRIDVNRPIESLSEGEHYEVRKWNRWGKVASPVTTIDDTVSHFVIEYDDGTKKQITVNKYYAWFVKKDSIPDSNTSQSDVGAPGDDSTPELPGIEGEVSQQGKGTPTEE